MILRFHISLLILLLASISSYSYANKNYYEVQDSDASFWITPENENLSQVLSDTNELGWLKTSDSPNFQNLNGKKNIWVRIKIPKQHFKNLSVCMNTFAFGYEIYQNGKVIYKYGDLANQKDYEYYKWHVIPLDTNTTSKYILLRIPISLKFIMGGFSVKYFGEYSALQNLVIQDMRKFFGGYTKEIILGIVLLCASFIAIIIFFIRMRARDYSFLYFALFTFLGALTYLDDTPIFMMQNISPMTYEMIENISLLTLPIGILLFIGKLFGYGWRNIIKKMCLLHIILLIITNVLNIFLILTAYSLICFVILVVIDFIAMIFVIYKSRKDTPYNIKPVFIAFIIFSILAIQDLLVMLGIIHWDLILFGFGLLGIVFSFGYILIRHYMDTYHLVNQYSVELAEKNDELDKLQQENLLSQFEALKSQINPHFLFNTFSTLISVIEENPELASDFVQQLSNVYRYVLESKENQTVELRSELLFLESYNFLLSKRYGSNLQIINCFEQEYYDRHIPPLTLQLLIENAIKHNIISSKKPLKIEILIDEDGYLVVKNNLQKKSIVESSTKIGLQNIINRYQYLSDKKVEVTSNPLYFLVRVPLLNVKAKK